MHRGRDRRIHQRHRQDGTRRNGHLRHHRGRLHAQPQVAAHIHGHPAGRLAPTEFGTRAVCATPQARFTSHSDVNTAERIARRLVRATPVPIASVSCPGEPGFHAWWVRLDRLADATPAIPSVEPPSAGNLVAPLRRHRAEAQSPTGVDRTIAARISKDHRGGNIGGSTVRQSLAAVMRDSLALSRGPPRTAMRRTCTDLRLSRPYRFGWGYPPGRARHRSRSPLLAGAFSKLSGAGHFPSP